MIVALATAASSLAFAQSGGMTFADFEKGLRSSRDPGCFPDVVMGAKIDKRGSVLVTSKKYKPVIASPKLVGGATPAQLQSLIGMKICNGGEP
ncbi:MAG: hypothetical protein Q7K57_17980 [Burkholderiaceae bacterium]|nr:hypothetical protein [Burkholderiaceae bacterium]